MNSVSQIYFNKCFEKFKLNFRGFTVVGICMGEFISIQMVNTDVHKALPSSTLMTCKNKYPVFLFFFINLIFQNFNSAT